MLLMSKGLEDRIADSVLEPEVKHDSFLFFGENKMSCAVLKISFDYTNDSRAIKLKTSASVINNIYNGDVPTGISHNGLIVEFEKKNLLKVSCESISSSKTPSAIVNLEIKK